MKKSVLFLIVLVSLIYSCKAPILASTIKNSKWKTETDQGYIEVISFNKDKSFLYERYVDDLLFESVKGTYSIFSAILGGCEYATIKFVNEDGRVSLLEFFVDPSGKSLRLMGHVETLYYLVEEVPASANSESVEAPAPNTASESNE